MCAELTKVHDDTALKGARRDHIWLGDNCRNLPILSRQANTQHRTLQNSCSCINDAARRSGPVGPRSGGAAADVTTTRQTRASAAVWMLPPALSMQPSRPLLLGPPGTHDKLRSFPIAGE